jgi:molybdenum cofactor cytidylyltransferase
LTGSRRIIAAVLAAGLATRFGSDKLLHPYRGKPLGAHIADVIAGMPFAARVAICPAGEAARAKLFSSRGFDVIENPDPGRGLSSSLALAADRAIGLDADALLICLADMPNVTAEHIAALGGASETSVVAATIAAGTPTPPAIFARSLFAQLTTRTDDKGAREVLRRAAMVEATPELVRDFDRPEDFD